MTPKFAREVARLFETEACAVLASPVRPHPLEAIREADRLSDIADDMHRRAADLEIARRNERRAARQAQKGPTT